jgi:CBS domain-containing protein
MLSPATTPTGAPQIAALMTRHPIAIGPNESVEVAATLMRSCRVRHLPVLEDGTLVGILSVRDVLAAEGTPRVGAVMSQAPVETIAPDASVTEGVERLLSRHISCLPVLSEGRIAGIFTATDALAFAVAQLEDDGSAARRPLTVAQLMTSRPLELVAPQATLASAWRIMNATRVRHLPVVRDETVVGILSDRDVLAVGRDWLRGDDDAGPDGTPALLVADAMSVRVSTIAADRPLLEAGRTLLRRRVGALPVLRGGRLLGILTVSDFLYWILGRV